MALQTGFGALAQTIKESAARANFSGARAGYFKLEPNERKIIRFLDDNIITADFANRVLCHDGKRQGFMIPDPNNNLVVKYAAPGAWDGKLKKMTVGIAVEREERITPPPPGSEERPRIEYVDKIETRDDGTKGRIFYVVMQSHGNFWDQLVGFHDVYHTITDRDYSITRIGKELETDYRIVPLDPAPNDPLRDPKTLRETYGYGKPWDKDDPNRFWWCPQTLTEWAEQYGGEERVRFLITGQREDGTTVASSSPPVANHATPQQPDPWGSTPQASGDPAPEADFAQLRDRLTGTPAPVPAAAAAAAPGAPVLGDGGSDEPPF